LSRIEQQHLRSVGISIPFSSEEQHVVKPKILPYPYDNRFILVSAEEAIKRGLSKPTPDPIDDRYVLVSADEASKRGIDKGRPCAGGTGPTKPDVDTLMRGFNDISKQFRELIEKGGFAGPFGDPSRGLDRDGDFPAEGGTSPATVSTPAGAGVFDFGKQAFEAGMAWCINTLKEGKTRSKEEILAAFYYQLGALAGRGFVPPNDPEEILGASEAITRSCDSRGACQDLGDKLDKLFGGMKRGDSSRGPFKDFGDWADKIRDCIKG
jgi:hypothetical protein